MKGLLVLDLRRALLVPRTLWCLALFLLLSEVSAMNAVDVCGAVSGSISGSGSFMITTGILPTLLYSWGYAADVCSRADPFWRIRGGCAAYGVSKYCASVLAAILFYWVGMLFFILLNLMRLPLMNGALSDGGPLGLLLEAGRPVAYILSKVTFYSLSAAFFAGAGFWMASYMPSRFVAVASPLVVYFFLHRLTDHLPIPGIWKMEELIQGMYSSCSVRETLIVKAVAVLLWLGFFGFTAQKRIERRARNG